MNNTTNEQVLRPGYPSFNDLPWNLPLQAWPGNCSRLEEAQRGLSRHPVVFVNYSGVLFALKELPFGLAPVEYKLLSQIEELRLPSVTPVGYIQLEPTGHKPNPTSVLITRYLEFSIPYRSLFIRSGLDRYRQHLLDAMAGLLVQLHLAGVYWGDCSLSNTLFRRDAGTLQAYLVDAETTEIYPPRLSPTLRHHDLEIMEENVDGEIADLASSGLLNAPAHFQTRSTGAYIRHSYQNLWEEVTRQQLIGPNERYHIQERIRALNALGFSVGSVEMQAAEDGDKLRLRFMVTDRNFHHDQLLGLTGLEMEESQARQMINEIQEIKAELSRANNRSTPLSVAAFHWLEYAYQPVIEQLKPLLERDNYKDPLGPAELYCQVLEHKWYLSEQARRDVGRQAATEDYLRRFS
jgi:hypothetical protein